MDQNSPMDGRLIRIPPIVWFMGAGLIVALLAIFVFNVTVTNVIYYGFLVLMMGSHFFMHGGHGGHRHASTSNTTESNENTIDPNKNEHSGHGGGCH